MSRPYDSGDRDIRESIPPELQALDKELSAIRIEERPSFAPELEGELLRAWRMGPRTVPGARRPWPRVLLAASVAALMITLSVPPARAAVVQVVTTVVQKIAPSLAPVEPDGARRPVVPAVVESPATTVEPAAEETAPSSVPPEEVDHSDPGNLVAPEVTITFPEVRFRREAEALIATYYPLALQRAGVGGSVKLMFWVDSLGVPENIQMREGSGYRSLNYAAMRAARELRFNPATRNGSPVGTWVEFQIHFVPGSGSGIMGLDPVGSEGVGGY